MKSSDIHTLTETLMSNILFLPTSDVCSNLLQSAEFGIINLYFVPFGDSQSC